jgi:CBS domain-containing protein
MLVSEVMTRAPITVRPGTTVKEALALLDEHSITMLPVVSAHGVIAGVLSEADLVARLMPHDERTHLLQAEDDLVEVPPHLVEEVMSYRVLTVTADSDLATAASLMSENSVKSLPVIDERRRVVGVVSRRDIVRVLARADDEIEAEIDALFRDLGVDWLVDVRDGVATVTGPVGQHESNLAETAARTVTGVVRVSVIAESWLGSRSGPRSRRTTG